SATAIVAPSPRDPPVTSAVFPVSGWGMCVLLRTWVIRYCRDEVGSRRQESNSCQLLTQCPAPHGIERIHCVSHDAATCAGLEEVQWRVRTHQGRDVAVLAVDTAFTCELGARRAPDPGGGTLAGRLETSFGV